MRIVKLSLLATALCLAASQAWAAPCVLPDNGSGTVDLPPNCPSGYQGQMLIVDGLPPGSKIALNARLHSFYGVIRTSGGSLGGEVQAWSASLDLDMVGEGGLAGYHRAVTLAVTGETHSAPRTPGSPVQSFLGDLQRLNGQITGDPDFDLLRVTAGTVFGLPSPGQTTLTLLPDGKWNVDSFFDITYRVDFIGAPGSPFAGRSGSTTGTNRFQAGEPPTITSCILPDNGSGTVDLPANCPDGYRGPMQILDGLLPGGTVDVAARLFGFTGVVRTPGGPLGGEVQTWNAQLEMEMFGTGVYGGYHRVLVLPATGETHSAPRVLGARSQAFDMDLFRLQAQLPPGDPDFDLLRVTAGTAFGLPSPGHTTLSSLPGGNWNVDSFFDVTYRIDFVGGPQGPFGGRSGSTTGAGRFKVGAYSPVAVDEIPLRSQLAVFPSWPNPFRAKTRILYRVPAGSGPVSLAVFDASGRLVRTLVGQEREPGLHTAEWDGRSDGGVAAAAGTYFCRLSGSGLKQAVPVTLLH